MGKPTVLELANCIGRKKSGSKSAYTYKDPEYMILEPVVTEEMAEVGIHLGFREFRSAEEVSVLSGKSLEETEKLLWDLAMTGACFVGDKGRVDKLFLIVPVVLPGKLWVRVVGI